MSSRALVVASAAQRAGSTSLLSHVAGAFAPAVARLWPAPHAPFLTAAAPRRHLVCLALAHGLDEAATLHALLSLRLRRAIPRALVAAPAGLERALGRMGDVAWPSAAYRKLVQLLADPKAAKVVRHAERLEADAIGRLAALPAPLGEAAHLALDLDAAGVAALREAYEALRFRAGERAAQAAAAGWARADGVRALLEAVRYDLTPEPLAPPHPGTARLTPIVSKAELRDAARRLRNCLDDRAPYAATGWSAYYLWQGPPAAVFEISRDHVYGWRLDEARIARNAAVPPEVREEIISELALMGVHVGRSGWELDRALNALRGGPGLRPVEDAVAEVFGAE